MTQPERSWTVASAKTHLSEVIASAMTDGPQKITKNGRDAVVVVSAEEWTRRTRRKQNLADFLLQSPLHDSGIDLTREPGGLREVDL